MKTLVLEIIVQDERAEALENMLSGVLEDDFPIRDAAILTLTSRDPKAYELAEYQEFLKGQSE